MRLSIIIPVLNEQQNIACLLSQLAPLKSKNCELIVVDGGSVDATLAGATSADKILITEPGRALQMNMGAAQASGEMLWFLHGDSLLEGDVKSYADKLVAKQAWGFFLYKT